MAESRLVSVLGSQIQKFYERSMCEDGRVLIIILSVVAFRRSVSDQRDYILSFSRSLDICIQLSCESGLRYTKIAGLLNHGL
jgi:hypothetical protein